MSGRAATTSIIEGKCALSVGDPGTPVPAGWLRVPLLEIAELGTGHTPSRGRSDYWDGGIPWIAIPDARDHHTAVITETTETVSQLGIENSAARILPAETVGLSRTASVGYVFIMGRPMATSQDFVTWTCSEALDPRFLMYALLSEGDDIRKFGKGSTHTTIYFPEVKAFNLTLAPKPEQRRIVAKLDSLRARSTRARNELDHIPKLIERYKQAILAKAFSGELTKEWRQEHRLNEEWGAETVGSLATEIRYGTSAKCSYAKTATAVLRIPNIGKSGISLDDLKYAEFSKQEIAKLALADGDLLFIRSNGSLGLVGRAAVVTPREAGLLYAGYLIRVRLDQRRVVPRFILHLFSEPATRAGIEALAKSTSGVNNINSEQLSAVAVPLPTIEEQVEIVQRIEIAYSWLDKIATEYARAEHLLPQLDQAILTKAFRGELVPQNPNDEPASVLLERIRAERQVGGKIRGRGTRA